jgi:hypothetical protein
MQKPLVVSLSAIVLCTAIAYSPLYTVPSSEWAFIQTWDDDSNFLENDLFRKLDWDNIVEMAYAVRINVWEPLGWYMKAIIFACFGLDSHANRVCTFCLHLLNSVLLYFVLRWAFVKFRLTDEGHGGSFSTDGPLIGSLFFALHPLNVEVIGWPSANPYGLSCFFALASLLAYKCSDLGAPSESSEEVSVNEVDHKWLLLSVACYVLAVLSKGVALTFPIAVLAIDFAATENVNDGELKDLFQRLVKYCAKRVLYAVAVFGALFATLSANAEGTNPMLDTQKLDTPQRIMKAFCTFGIFVGKAIWPAQLQAHYQVQEWKLDVTNPPNEALLGIMLFCTGTIVAVTFWREKSGFAAFWAYFVFTMLPTVGIIQHGMIAMGGDRYMYFPMLGVSALLGAVYQSVTPSDDVPQTDGDYEDEELERALLKKGWLGNKRALSLFSAVFWLLCSTFFTYRQILTWRSDVYVWKHTIQLDPTDWRSMDQLVEYYVKHGRTNEASVYFDRIEWHSPTVGLKAEMHFAKFRIMRGKLMEACGMYESAMNKYGVDPILYNNLGVCALQKDNRAVALAFFKEGLGVAVQDRHKSTLNHNAETLESNLEAMKSRGEFAQRYSGKHAFIF